MVIEKMTVTEALISIKDAVGTLNEQTAYRDSTPEMDEIRVGLRPRWTGLKPGIKGNPSAFQLYSEDALISGEVTLCGQWVWYNPNQSIPRGWAQHLVVVVPSMVRSEFRSGMSFEVGGVFFSLEDDVAFIRNKIAEGFDEITIFASQKGFLKP